MYSMHEVLKNKLTAPSNSPETDCKQGENRNVDWERNDEERCETPSTIKKTKRCELFSRRNIFAMFYLICLIGCAYQMIEVLILYFKYETVTTLKIEKSTTVIPPSMSVCFPYITLVKLPTLFEKHPKLLSTAYQIMNKSGEKIDFQTHRIRNFKKTKGKFDWEFGLAIENELTISEIINVTVSLEEMFLQCVVKSPETYVAMEYNELEKCREIWITDYYVKDENKCFMFGYKDRPNYDYVYNLEKLSNSFSFRTLLHQLRLEPDLLTASMERAYVIFHPRYRLPRGRVDPLISIKYPYKNVSYSTTYSKIVSTLMPSPYGSDCKEYSELGFESRNDCVDKCTVNESFAIYGRVPYNMVFEKNSNLKVFGFKSLAENQTLVNKFEDIVEQCSKKCSNRDCFNEYYPPSLLATEEGTKLKFLADIPSSLDINTELSAKLTLLEYIIYNTSVFGFWFGLCVLQLADFVEYIKEKRKAAKKLLKKQNMRLTKSHTNSK